MMPTRSIHRIGMLAVLVIGGLSVVASAQTPVTDLLTETSVAAAVTQLTALNTLLLSGAPVSPGNGLIQVLVSMDNKLGEINTFDATALSNQDALARLRTYQQAAINEQMKSSVTTTQFQTGCAMISAAYPATSTAAGTRAAAAVAGAGLAKAYDQSVPSSVARAALLVNTTRSCTAADVQQHLPGCIGAAPGPAPMANRSIQSLTRGDAFAYSAGVSKQLSNRSLDANQYGDAVQAIQTLAPLPAPLPPQNLLTTPTGAQYAVQRARYTDRASAVINALNHIAALSAAINASGQVCQTDPATQTTKCQSAPGIDPQALQDWANEKTAYQQMFPGVAWPQNPSERELLNFEVTKDVSDPHFLAQVAATQSKSTLLHYLFGVQALGNQLAWLRLQQGQDTNELLAALLSQKLDPVTRVALIDQRARIASGQQGN